MIKVAVEKALEKHRANQDATLDLRTAIERELSLLEAYEKNLVDAIAKGQRVEPLLAKLEAEEARKEELTKELEQLDSAGDIGSLNEAPLKRELKARLADMRGLLKRHVSLFSSTLTQNPARSAATL